MPLLALKLVVTPLLIGGASLAARRWGPSVGGLIVAFPLTTGPVMLFVALTEGREFAATAVIGTMVGLLSISVYSVVHCRAVGRLGPLPAIALAGLAYGLAALAFGPLADLPGPVVALAAAAGIAAALRLLPPPAPRRVRRGLPAWDLPGRVVVGTTLVVVISTIAPLLGPHASGVVASFPLYVSVVAGFAHATEGAASAIEVQRGLLAGLFGTTAFALLLHLAIVPLGIAAAFALAIAATLLLQALALRLVRAAALEPLAEPELV